MDDRDREDVARARADLLARAAELRARGEHEEAAALLASAAGDRPEDRALLMALADAQRAAGLRRDALSSYNRLIALGDVAPEVWNAIGEELLKSSDFTQAIAVFSESLAAGETAEARHSLGQAQFGLGDIDAAVDNLEIAAVQHGLLASSLALATLIPGAPGADQARILEVRRACAEKLAGTPFANTSPAPNLRDRAPGEPIRVGYLSSWFTRANYMKPVWALINEHDRERVEVHLFSDSADGDRMEGYDAHADDRLHLTKGQSNPELAATIAEAGIDVLVDLNAYSTQRRLGLFVNPPAPITVAWFNMYATSGLPGIHAIIGDHEVVGPEDEPFYSERVMRLPTSYLTFTTPHRTPPVVDPPSMTSDRITFGSLIAQYKMTGDVIDAWSEILGRVPSSRLFLANRATGLARNCAWIAERFAEHGIAADRLIFGGPASHYDYLRNYDRIDIALDAFPYNGGTTTMEAIWQGVPVLTFDGGRWASRTSQTLLRRTHLGAFACGSRPEMIDKAVALAQDPATPAMLRSLRHEMRDRLLAAPVCDAAALARGMEDLLEGLVAERTVDDASIR